MTHLLSAINAATGPATSAVTDGAISINTGTTSRPDARRAPRSPELGLSGRRRRPCRAAISGQTLRSPPPAAARRPTSPSASAPARFRRSTSSTPRWRRTICRPHRHHRPRSTSSTTNDAASSTIGAVTGSTAAAFERRSSARRRLPVADPELAGDPRQPGLAVQQHPRSRSTPRRRMPPSTASTC